MPPRVTGLAPAKRQRPKMTMSKKKMMLMMKKRSRSPAGRVQPNMRDRRTPVNRDLQIGFGSARPNPDANGRGVDPVGRRSPAALPRLVLGVPIPDRVNGQPNKGRIRITQQRITPEIEESDPSGCPRSNNIEWACWSDPSS